MSLAGGAETGQLTGVRDTEDMAVTTVVLLRGINVGGHNRLPMADLRSIAEGLEYTDVATHVQSGNLVLTGADPPDQAAARVQDALRTATDIDVRAVARSADEWMEVIDRNPFAAEAAADGKLVHVTFLVDSSVVERLASIDVDQHSPERFVVSGREIYQALPNGLSGGTLATALDKAIDDPAATRRNWNTVETIARLL